MARKYNLNSVLIFNFSQERLQLGNNMLTIDEEQHKYEIIELPEDVLEAKGMECDSKISKISERQLREILEEVRKLRRKRKRLSLADNRTDSNEQKEELEHQHEEEMPYIK